MCIRDSLEDIEVAAAKMAGCEWCAHEESLHCNHQGRGDPPRFCQAHNAAGGLCLSRTHHAAAAAHAETPPMPSLERA
eukprot:5633209-Prorocentrum_lima.AAC.1